MSSTASRIDEPDPLVRLLQVTASETGEEFFEALVANLSETLGVRGAWVTEYLEDQGRLRSVAFWYDGALQPTYEYDVAGTPCETVVAGEFVHVPDRVVDLYPADPDLEALEAVAYLGYPFTDGEGRIVGHVAIIDSEPFPDEPSDVALFEVFAERAAAEMRRLRAEAAVAEREEKLTRLLDSAMDAILELDEEFHVVRANPAAERIFGWPLSSIEDGPLARMVSEESLERLRTLADELAGRPPGRQFTWVSGGLEGRGSDGMFPAEASISRFTTAGGTYYTLILRSVADRLEAERAIRSLEDRAEYLREELAQVQGSDEIVGCSRPMLRVLRDVRQVADTDTTVLVQGDTGTGKELIARAIHAGSPRAGRPLVKVNCAAIPENLIESELFGHEKGAFTGATRTRDGRFAIADGGTIFLDEIGELPLSLQPKLLRVLQEGEFERVGSDRTRTTDIRVIAATNRDLEREVEEGRFRSDLYYRLAVFVIEVPPLRERGEDVVLIARRIAERLAADLGREPPEIGPQAARRLMAYDWPGNVRELQNVVERALITSRDIGHELDTAPAVAQPVDAASAPAPEAPILTTAEMREFERSNLVRALESSGWKVAGDDGAARRLGMPPSTLSSRMKALGIERPD